MLVPTAFGEVHGVVTNATGNVIDEFVEPASAKGASNNQQRATTASCRFTLTETFDEPGLGVVTLTVTGSVTGFVTPVR